MKIDFYQVVYNLVKKIPKGKVATYGQVASLLDKPKAARLVGLALARSPAGVPWQRIINRKGMVSIENLNYPKELQVKILQKEGIKIMRRDNNWWIDLKQYLWSK